VYVVVLAGVTCAVPESGFRVPAPGSGAMLTRDAPVTLQDRVLDWPAVTPAGEAVNELTAGGVIRGPPPPPSAEGADTVTVAVAVGLFVPSVAVSVYVVVEVGETAALPEATGVTEPTPLLMAALVQFEVVQESVEELPDVMPNGEAENPPMAHGAATVTMAWAVLVPAPLVAVSVYVVVLPGVTVAEPLGRLARDPTPPSMLAVIAPATDQDRVADRPAVMDVGDALNTEISGGTPPAQAEVADGVTVTAAGLDAVKLTYEYEAPEHRVVWLWLFVSV
jgi:hypothetical protein